MDPVNHYLNQEATLIMTKHDLFLARHFFLRAFPALYEQHVDWHALSMRFVVPGLADTANAI